MKRRDFLLGCALLPLAAKRPERIIITVTGSMRPRDLGITLVHEHVMVDFAGADETGPGRYDSDKVFRVARPYLDELKSRGCATLVECTPAYLARDPVLLRRLSQATGLKLVTNTGYYGAANDKFVPPHAYRETAQQLSSRWVGEFRKGIEGTGIRPGFIKTGVDPGPLSSIDRKLVEAAGLCHLETGLTIYVHTGDGEAAMQTISSLREIGVSPGAYVWVHAQNEKDRALHLKAAEQGAWLSFDGISDKSADKHVRAVTEMIARGYLRRLLISQDAGWYHVGEPGGGNFRGYTYLFDHFIPALSRAAISAEQIRTLLLENPSEALQIRIRRR